MNMLHTVENKQKIQNRH